MPEPRDLYTHLVDRPRRPFRRPLLPLMNQASLARAVAESTAGFYAAQKRWVELGGADYDSGSLGKSFARFYRTLIMGEARLQSILRMLRSDLVGEKAEERMRARKGVSKAGELVWVLRID